jgi:hypothetical protein
VGKTATKKRKDEAPADEPVSAHPADANGQPAAAEGDAAAHPDAPPETPDPQPADDPASPAALALYDQETARLATALNDRVAEARSAYDAAHEDAKDAKKVWEGRVEELHNLIRDRKAQRGKKPDAPAPTLFDGWRNLPVGVLKLDGRAAEAVGQAGFATVGELAEAMVGGLEWAAGLTDEETLAIRSEVDAAADGKRNPPAPAADPLAELWREFPIDRWTEFGLTAADVKKLAAGEAKTGPSHPIVTVGDLQRFTTPYPNNPDFTRGYADVKGLGTAGADRISAAEERFWRAWRSEGLDRAFAFEKGIDVPEPAGGPA